MTSHGPTLQAALFLLAFSVMYFAVLLKNAMREQIDTYDFVLLTSVAVIPAAFVVFPETMWSITRFVGVEFPFLLLFGGIMTVAFILLWRAVRRLAKLREQVTRVAQECALMRNELDEFRQTVAAR